MSVDEKVEEEFRVKLPKETIDLQIVNHVEYGRAIKKIVTPKEGKKDETYYKGPELDKKYERMKDVYQEMYDLESHYHIVHS